MIGLTGGLACGKSFVAAALRELGCHVLEADEIGHEVSAPGGEAYHAIVAEFGREILNEHGSIDRSRLAALVFSDPAALAKLNAIVHPAVRERMWTKAREISQREPGALIVYVAAILIESGGHRDMEKLIVVNCGRE